MKKTYPAIHLAAEKKDDLRPAFQHVMITREKTAASNAHILIEHDTTEVFGEDFVSTLPDEQIFVHVDSAKLMLATGADNHRYNDGVISFEKNGQPQIVPVVTSPDWEFPQYESVFPTGDLVPIDKIGINPGLLLNLTKAMGCTIVKLMFYGESRAMMVYPLDGYDYISVRAIIMPMMIHKS